MTMNEMPNAETIAAMEEVEVMKQHPEQYPGFTEVDAMMQKLCKESN